MNAGQSILQCHREARLPTRPLLQGPRFQWQLSVYKKMRDSANSRVQVSANSPEARCPTSWLNACSLWYPDCITDSAWIEHAPFAFWLIDALRPRTVVELGTHFGYSYFCFCQAVKTLASDTRCYAVDKWTGDQQSGFYGEDVFHNVSDYNGNHYASFSSLVRSSFAEAVAHFSDGSIDLLHIDGLHDYASVKGDFDTWKPKLSERSVVLFHDCNVREHEFGVFRLWESLRDQYPSFEFIHGHGLGILGTGSSLPTAIRDLFGLTKNEATRIEVRDTYSRLGGVIATNTALERAKNDLRTISGRLHAMEEARLALSKELDAERATHMRNVEEARLVLSKELDAERTTRVRDTDQLIAERNRSALDRNAMQRTFVRQSAIIGRLHQENHDLHQENHDLTVRTNELQQQNRALNQQNQAFAARHKQMTRLVRHFPASLKALLTRLLFRETLQS
jgi:hypothetical protein